MLAGFARALVDFVSDGCTLVTHEQYHERLLICQRCIYRGKVRCLKCGCLLVVKARGRAFECPIGKWPAIPDLPTDDPPGDNIR